MLPNQGKLAQYLCSSTLLVYAYEWYILSLNPFSSDSTALLETWAPNSEIIPAERLFFKSQKLLRLVIMTLKTLYQTFFQNFFAFLRLLNAACWLSSVTGVPA